MADTQNNTPSGQDAPGFIQNIGQTAGGWVSGLSQGFIEGCITVASVMRGAASGIRKGIGRNIRTARADVSKLGFEAQKLAGLAEKRGADETTRWGRRALKGVANARASLANSEKALMNSEIWGTKVSGLVGDVEQGGKGWLGKLGFAGATVFTGLDMVKGYQQHGWQGAAVGFFDGATVALSSVVGGTVGGIGGSLLGPGGSIVGGVAGSMGAGWAAQTYAVPLVNRKLNSWFGWQGPQDAPAASPPPTTTANTPSVTGPTTGATPSGPAGTTLAATSTPSTPPPTTGATPSGPAATTPPPTGSTGSKPPPLSTPYVALNNAPYNPLLAAAGFGNKAASSSIVYFPNTGSDTTPPTVAAVSMNTDTGMSIKLTNNGANELGLTVYNNDGSPAFVAARDPSGQWTDETHYPSTTPLDPNDPTTGPITRLADEMYNGALAGAKGQAYTPSLAPGAPSNNLTSAQQLTGNVLYPTNAELGSPPAVASLTSAPPAPIGTGSRGLLRGEQSRVPPIVSFNGSDITGVLDTPGSVVFNRDGTATFSLLNPGTHQMDPLATYPTAQADQILTEIKANPPSMAPDIIRYGGLENVGAQRMTGGLSPSQYSTLSNAAGLGNVTSIGYGSGSGGNAAPQVTSVSLTTDRFNTLNVGVVGDRLTLAVLDSRGYPELQAVRDPSGQWEDVNSGRKLNRNDPRTLLASEAYNGAVADTNEHAYKPAAPAAPPPAVVTHASPSNMMLALGPHRGAG